MKKLKAEMVAFKKSYDSALEDLKRKVATMSDVTEFDNQLANFVEVQIKLQALVDHTSAAEE